MKNQQFSVIIMFMATALIGMVASSNTNAQCRTDVNWGGLTNCSASGTTLTFTGGSCWASGAYDNAKAVGPGGYVQFQAGHVGSAKMLALNSDPTANHSYCSHDYSWYPYDVKRIYEHCSSKGTFGTYTTSDVFKIYWNPFNNRIEYYVNDVLNYTSANIPSATLYVDASFCHSGSQFTNVTVAGGDCQKCPSPVNWEGVHGNSTANGNTITKTAGGNGWSTGAYSMLPVNAGGFVQFQAGQNNTYKMIGLNSDPTTDYSYCSLDYAWYPHAGGSTNIYESCSSRGGHGGSYNTSDVFMIYWNPSNNRIEYYKNKSLIYTSSIIPSGTYYVDISLYTQGASFTNIIVQGGGCSYTKDFF